MSTPEEWPMDRTTAESLLRGDRTGHPLDRVLAAASAPAGDRELAGEAAAMAAFRAAAQTPARRRPSAVRSALAKLLTLKVAAVAFATTATIGGVSLAANTSTLSGPAGVAEPPVTVSRPAQPRPSTPAPSRTRPSASRPASTPASPSGPSTRSSAPDRTTELCREFGRRDRDWNDERFRELERRAGARNRIDRFCGFPAGSRTGDPRRTTGWPKPGSSAEPRR
ncbi:hypothetical protein [Actinoplanes utahensis]|uniref:hypothetical protein n=1 Tax=Actinoplanes utahensis TaxID=1869 RepID=UPI00068C219F|nr:hypothetical protein [Actinoplanes utahensis]GIF31251.1 hypothetical protein Aut01nite_42370 [Actinoplanes utahensis]